MTRYLIETPRLGLRPLRPGDAADLGRRSGPRAPSRGRVHAHCREFVKGGRPALLLYVRRADRTEPAPG